MLFVAILQDLPGMASARHGLAVQEHLTHLGNAGIKAAGPLRVTTDGPIVGGLWIIEANTRADAAALVEGDVYFQAGLRRYELFNWSKVGGTANL